MKILEPLSTQLPFSSFTAVVCWPWASVPAPGSVRPKAPIHSPEHSLGRYFCFCSSVPYSKIGLQHRLVWADSTTLVVPHTLAISSTAIT